MLPAPGTERPVITDQVVEQPNNDSVQQPPVDMTDPSFNRTHAEATATNDQPSSLPDVAVVDPRKGGSSERPKPESREESRPSEERDRPEPNRDRPHTPEVDEDVRSVLGADVYAAYATYADGTEAFNHIDTDRNGFVSSQELQQYIDRLSQQQRLTEAEQRRLEAARHMLENINTLQGASNDEWGPERSGISRADLRENLLQAVWANQNQIFNRVDHGARRGPIGITFNDGTNRRTTAPGFQANQDTSGLFPTFSLTFYDPRRNTTVEIRDGGADGLLYGGAVDTTGGFRPVRRR